MISSWQTSVYRGNKMQHSVQSVILCLFNKPKHPAGREELTGSNTDRKKPQDKDKKCNWGREDHKVKHYIKHSYYPLSLKQYAILITYNNMT